MKDEQLVAVLADPNQLITSEDIAKLSNVAQVIRFPEMLNEDEWAWVVSLSHILVHNGHWKLTGELVDQAPHLQLVCSAGTGSDWVENPSLLRQRDIDVTNVPNYATNSVAELAIGLMISSSKYISELEHASKKGNWLKKTGMELAHKNLAVIGAGHIGTRIGQIARDGLRMNIQESHRTTTGKELLEMLQWAHVVCIAAALTEETRGMIGQKEFDAMRDGVVIVNISRGEVIDEQVFIDALRAGKVAAAGLDVLSVEPPDENNPLLHMKNVLVTCHNASNTREALERLSAEVVENIRCWIQGNPRNVVN